MESAKVYKLISSENSDLVYYGSTTRTLRERLANHKTSYKKYLKGQTNYCSSFQILELGPDTVSIILIENIINCPSKMFLHLRELFYILFFENVNKNIPLRNNKQYHIDKRNEISMRKRAYYIQNRDKILNKKHDYISCNNCGDSVKKTYIAPHKRTRKCMDYHENNEINELETTLNHLTI